MPYANTTTKRDQVLEQLRINMDAIAPADYANDVKRAVVYENQRVVLGGQMPSIVIGPLTDTRQRAFTCDSDEYSMRVQIVGVLRIDSTTDEWKPKIHLLAGDVQQAIANDRQLSGKAVYIEVEEVDIPDASVSGNRTLAACIITATIVYRVGMSDVTT